MEKRIRTKLLKIIEDIDGIIDEMRESEDTTPVVCIDEGVVIGLLMAAIMAIKGVIKYNDESET